MANGISFATVSGIFQKPNERVIARVAADNVGGVVARSVINDDDLRVPPLLGDVGENLVQSLGDALALVVRRYDDTVRRNSTGGRILLLYVEISLGHRASDGFTG
jgi:hypothetical protein